MLRSSRAFVRLPVASDPALTTGQIEMQVNTSPTVVADDWLPADAYEDGEAKLLVGPGSDRGELDLGLNRIRVRVTVPESPERPEEYAGAVWVEG